MKVKINKIPFYALAGIIIFVLTFVAINFPAFYLRLKSEKHGQIVYDELSKTKVKFIYPADFLSGLGQGSESSYDDSLSSNFIYIDKINARAPLVFASGTTQKELDQALNQGVVIYPGSASPGQVGEVFLTGHSSTFIWNETPYGQVFALLDRLQAGDFISLTYNEKQYDYRVTDKGILSAGNIKITKTSQSLLTLMTCWPPGTTLKRLVVRAELVE